MTHNQRESEKLPDPKRSGAVSLEEALSRRRSVRRFAGRALTMAQISQLLWAAQGVTGTGKGLRTAPSAGAVYPLETYAVTPDGFFLYEPGSHSLEKIDENDLRPALASAAFGQDFVAQSPLSIVLCVDYAKIKKHYGERGIRYADIEAGHAAQNVHLEAAALELASVPVGAFNTKDVHALLRLPAYLEPVYIIPVGYPK